MATKKANKNTTENDAPQLQPGILGYGVFIMVDESGKLWRFDADAGTFRELQKV